jgi:hypothetical protein
MTTTVQIYAELIALGMPEHRSLRLAKGFMRDGGRPLIQMADAVARDILTAHALRWVRKNPLMLSININGELVDDPDYEFIGYDSDSGRDIYHGSLTDLLEVIYNAAKAAGEQQ